MKIIDFAKKLQKFYRSLSGRGNIETLKLIRDYSSSKLKIKHFKSGSKVFDWIVPDEWEIKDAYILTPDKKKICEYKKNFLHVVGYSKKVNMEISLNNLKEKLYSSKKLKNAIPYVTSYYNKDWGFCLPYNQKKRLKKGNYKVFIDSKFKKGKIHYGECILNGKSKNEVFFSTYICHPFMANNEISGPTVLTFLINWIERNFSNLNYTYRFIFIPETIGSIAYLNKNLMTLKKNTFAGFNITCVGDERFFSMIPSRNGNTYSDKILNYVLNDKTKKFKKYNWEDRGSDERQYCSPGIDLPIATFCKSKFGTFPEYHTSADDFGNLVTNKGLNESLEILKKIIEIIEKNEKPISKIFCEPFLTKYNLYPSVSRVDNDKVYSKKILNFLTWSDGNFDLLDISKKLNISFEEILQICSLLKQNNFIK